LGGGAPYEVGWRVDSGDGLCTATCGASSFFLTACPSLSRFRLTSFPCSNDTLTVRIRAPVVKIQFLALLLCRWYSDDLLSHADLFFYSLEGIFLNVIRTSSSLQRGADIILSFRCIKWYPLAVDSTSRRTWVLTLAVQFLVYQYFSCFPIISWLAFSRKHFCSCSVSLQEDNMLVARDVHLDKVNLSSTQLAKLLANCIMSALSWLLWTWLQNKLEFCTTSLPCVVNYFVKSDDHTERFQKLGEDFSRNVNVWDMFGLWNTSDEPVRWCNKVKLRWSKRQAHAHKHLRNRNVGVNSVDQDRFYCH